MIGGVDESGFDLSVMAGVHAQPLKTLHAAYVTACTRGQHYHLTNRCTVEHDCDGH